MGHKEELAGGGLVRSVGGWKELISMKRLKQMQQGDERILGDGDFVEDVLRDSDEKIEKRTILKRAGWGIARLIKYVCELTGVNEALIREKRKKKKISEARSLIAYWGVHELGLNGTQLGSYFGVTKQAIAYLSKQGEKTVDANKYVLSI